MRLADSYPLVAIVIIAFCILCILVGYDMMVSPKQPQSDIRAEVIRGNPEKGKVGELIFIVYGRWGKDVVAFHDTLIDQELDSVMINKRSSSTTDPNFPNLETWKNRYQEVRKEYITGRKP